MLGGSARITKNRGFPKRTAIHKLFEALGKLGYENDRTATIDLLAEKETAIG